MFADPDVIYAAACKHTKEIPGRKFLYLAPTVIGSAGNYLRCIKKGIFACEDTSWKPIRAALTPIIS